MAATDEMKLKDEEIASLKQRLQALQETHDDIAGQQRQMQDEHRAARREAGVLDGALTQLLSQGDGIALELAALGQHLAAVERVVADMRARFDAAAEKLDQHAKVKDEVRRL